MSRLFGTDGVRGEANKALTPEMAYRLGRAATLYFGKGTKQLKLGLFLQRHQVQDQDVDRTDVLVHGTVLIHDE